MAKRNNKRVAAPTSQQLKKQKTAALLQKQQQALQKNQSGGDVKTAQKQVLCVGIPQNIVRQGLLHPSFQTDTWKKVTLHSNPKLNPDIVANIFDLSSIPDNSYDAVTTNGDLEYVAPHQLPKVLAEFKRIVKIGGLVLIGVADAQKLGEYINKLKDNTVVMRVPSVGNLTAHDLLYGHADTLAKGIDVLPRVGYTSKRLGEALKAQGFGTIRIKRDKVYLWAAAYKDNKKPFVTLLETDINEVIRKRDDIDKEPAIWKGFPPA